MKTKLESRCTELRDEYAAGQKMLAELEAKQTQLRDTLLRISGAIQVLEEVLTELPHPSNGVVPQAEALTAAGEPLYAMP